MSNLSRSFALILPFVWALLMAFWPSAGQAQLTYEDAKRRLIRLTVAIDRGAGHEMLSSHASGYFIDQTGMVLTVRHLVPDAWRDELQNPNAWHRFQFFGQIGGGDETIPLSLYAVHEGGRDVILLKAGGSIGQVSPFLPISRAVEIPFQAELEVFGFPTPTLQRRRSALTVPCTPDRSCEINPSLPPGFSGGAVVQETLAVGLVTRSGVDQESTFIPLAAILHWISTLVDLPPANGSAPEAVTESIPRPFLPRDGAQLTVYPRLVTLQWSAVGEDLSYAIEVEIQNPRDGVWSPHPSGLGRKIVASNSFTFVFVGSQPGRWRVAARDSDGTIRSFSHWSHFDFSPPPDPVLPPVPLDFSPAQALRYQYQVDGQPCDGYFFGNGLGLWVEVTSSSAGEGCIDTEYRFREINQDQNQLLLSDAERGYFILLPLDGGWARVGSRPTGPFQRLHRVERLR